MTKSPSKPRTTRTDGRAGRFYDITHADGTTARYPSVTTILSAIAKPALVGWAAKEERLAVSEAAADFHAETAGRQLPRSMYLLGLEQRLGKTKAHLKVLAAASEIGTAIHGKIEWILKRQLGQIVGPEPQLVDEAEWAVMAFDDLRKAVNLAPILIEQIIWSRQHEYAGTLDLVARLDGPALLTVLAQQGPVDASLATWLAARDTVTACIDFKSGRAVYGESLLQSAAYTRALIEMGHGPVDGGLIIRLPKVLTDPAFQVVVVPPASKLLPTFLAAKELWTWQFQQEQAYQARRKAVA